MPRYSGVSCWDEETVTYGYVKYNFYGAYLSNSPQLVMNASARCYDYAGCISSSHWNPPNVLWHGTADMIFGIPPIVAWVGAIACWCGDGTSYCGYY